jgi:hypothetical protein
LHRTCHLDNCGVEVPAGIGNTVVLHTIVVVNVNAAGSKAFLKELKKLTQLRKLGVWASTLKAGRSCVLPSRVMPIWRLESLSVQLEKDNQGLLAYLDDISHLRKTLETLKLHGNVHIATLDTAISESQKG